MITTIKNATIVNDGQVFNADIVIENEIIADIVPEGAHCTSDTCFNASGCIVMPGIIDMHVHFREPGMTDKADIASESAAAAAGGVTSYFEMPNTKPQTVTPKALEEKFMLAQNKSIVNYSFFFGATSGNINDIRKLDRRRVCGVKVFMGSSTGNMLVDNKNALYDIFSSSTLPIVTHCEDTGIISENASRIRELYGNEADVSLHPVIRSEEACFKSTELAIELARETGAQLHVAHISTTKELELFDALSNKITAEACLPHLIFSEEDYATKKALIKCNPAIKSKADREALRKGLTNGKIRTVATDHAPHQLKDKAGGALQAASGMPFVQFSLISMLLLSDKGILPVTRIAELMAHNPARLFNVENRGFIKRGYFADLAIVRKSDKWTLDKNGILSKCKWSPLEGETFDWRVERTYCNGKCVYDCKTGVNAELKGKEITFCR